MMAKCCQRGDRTDWDVHRPGLADDGGGSGRSRGNTWVYHQHAPEPNQHGPNSGEKLKQNVLLITDFALLLL